MQSKKSFFNGTIFKKNVMGCWPLWAFAAFMACFVPASTFLSNRQLDTADAIGVLISVVGYSPEYMLGMAIVASVLVWHFLHINKRVGFYHSIPVSRDCLFITNTISAFVIMLIPYVVGGILLILMCVGNGVPFAAFGKALLIVLAEMLLFYSIAVFCIMATGSTALSVILYIVFAVLGIITEWLVGFYTQGLLYGVTTSGLDLSWLTPIKKLLKNVFMSTVLETQEYPGGNTDIVTEVTGGNIVVIYAVIGLLVLIISYLLYKYRASESAGDTIAVKWFKPIFKFGLAIYTALTLGLLLYWLTFGIVINGDYFNILGISICMSVAGVIGYFGGTMIVKKSFKVFKKAQILRAVALVVLSFAFCFGIKLDIAGLEGRVPDTTDIARLEVKVDGRNHIIYEGENGYLTEFTDLHKAIVSDADYYKSQEALKEGSAGTVYFDYTLKDGTLLSREYYIYKNPSEKNNPDSVENRIEEVKNNTDLLNRAYHFYDDHYKVESIYVQDKTSNSIGDTYAVSSEIDPIMKAIYADLESGNEKVSLAESERCLMGDVSPESYVMLELNFRVYGTENLYGEYITLLITPEWTNTMLELKANGMIG